MDPWKYISDAKNLLLFEDQVAVSAVDDLGRARSPLAGDMGWEMKPFPHAAESHLFISNTEALEQLELMRFGFPGMIPNAHSRDRSSRDGLSDQAGGNSYGNNPESPTATSNVVYGEKDSGVGASSCFMEYSSSEDSPPIDLKLGCLPAGSRGSKDGELLNGGKDIVTGIPLVLSNSPTRKAGRSRSLHSQTPFCQVYGCNMDLSFSKGYHKRHKVCDLHSKTAKVIVNGIEQRFCQQCSRFHLLSEFDYGKRSCRRRLANHNERRRKPQIAALSGTRFLDASLVKRASFLFPNMLPGMVVSPNKVETCKWVNNYIKCHEDPTRASNSFLHMHSGEDHRMVDVSSRSGDNTVGSGTASSVVQDIYGASNSSCALSLLSTQSHDLRGDMLGGTTARPRLNKLNHDNYYSTPYYGCSVGSWEKVVSNVLHPPEMKPMRIDEAGSTATISYHDGYDANYKVSGSDTLLASDFMKTKHCISSCQDVMDHMFQPALHLERVEQQRTSMDLMQKTNYSFYGFPPPRRE